MEITDQIKTELSEWLDTFWKAYMKGDLDLWSTFIKEDYCHIGGRKEEIWHSKQEILDNTHAILDQMSGDTEMRNREIEVLPYGDKVMVDEFADLYVKVDGAWSFYRPFRISSLMEKTAIGWIALHQHGSYPDMKAVEGEAFAHDTLKAENKKLQLSVEARTKELVSKNRELEIEAALERVRSQSMAMRHTSDLQEVVNTLAHQLLRINIDINGGIFIVVNEKVGKDIEIWGCGGAANYVKKAVIPYLNKPIYFHSVSSIKKKVDFLVEVYTREEKIEFFEHLFKYPPWKFTPEKKKKQLLSLKGGYTRSWCISPHTSIFMINNTGKVFSAEDNDILKRFGKIFEQTYTRFLDLQKAEELAREAMHQAALDRVRGEIASMRNPEDLKHISQIVFSELTSLGVPFIRCGVFIVDEQKSKVHVYLSTPNGQSLGVLELHYPSLEFMSEIVSSWKKGAYHRKHWDRDDFVRWTKLMMEMGQIRDENTYQGNDAPPSSLDLHFVPFEQGMLYVGSRDPLNEQQLQLVQNLADTFAMAYARYEDFSQLEKAKEKLEVALTDIKATQEQMVQQEKLASLGQLTAGIAHEIKNPLNFMNNFSEISIELIEEVREELKLKTAELNLKNSFFSGDSSFKNEDEEETAGMQEGGRNGIPKIPDLDCTFSILNDIETYLNKIKEHGNRADRIVTSMLHHSRSGSGALEPTNLNSLIKEFVNLAFLGMQAAKNPINVDICFQLDEHILPIPLIAQDFSRVILNMCTNAFDAMRENLSAVDQKPYPYKPQLSIMTKRMDGEILVEFKDNGTGIRKEIKEKIMQPFFTTKKGKEGTGLGLYITSDIIKAHGGQLKVKTQEGVGTAFIISIPVKK
ncbi:MAG: ATP-binding protein [Salegentibacter sp.]